MATSQIHKPDDARGALAAASSRVEERRTFELARDPALMATAIWPAGRSAM
jgi:hypothetical protein